MNSVVAGMSSILTRMGRVYRVLRRVHHVRVVPLFLAVLFGLLRTVVWFGMLLDRLGVMAEMCVFLEHPMTPELCAQVHELGEKQRKYESEHRYNLAKFGLTEARIRSDCAFFYDTFLPPLPADSWIAPPGSAPPIAAPGNAS